MRASVSWFRAAPERDRKGRKGIRSFCTLVPFHGSNVVGIADETEAKAVRYTPCFSFALSRSYTTSLGFLLRSVQPVCELVYSACPCRIASVCGCPNTAHTATDSRPAAIASALKWREKMERTHACDLRVREGEYGDASKISDLAVFQHSYAAFTTYGIIYSTNH